LRVAGRRVGERWVGERWVGERWVGEQPPKATAGPEVPTAEWVVFMQRAQHLVVARAHLRRALERCHRFRQRLLNVSNQRRYSLRRNCADFSKDSS
jgi:hypothetical protein